MPMGQRNEGQLLTKPVTEHRDATTDEETQVLHARYLAERQERERLDDRLDSLLNALPAAVVLLDGQGRVQQMNPAAESLLGVALRGQFWGDCIGLLFAPPDGSGGDDLLLRNGRYVSLSTSPLANEPGQILMLHDVTEKRQFQTRLEHNRRLADMGQMAASLAHQIRTPLASALLYVSQLKGLKPISEMQQRFVGKALDSLKGLEKLISDMLLFANGGSGRNEVVSVCSLLQEAVEPLQAKMGQQGVALEWSLPDEALYLQANPSLLKSALQNLLNNALQAMGDVGGVLRLSAEAGDGQVVVRVQDNGPGIEATLLPRLFEPFVSGRSEGTGLGLAVVRAVVRSAGGEVWCDSQPGEGSCFTLRFPFCQDSPPGSA